MAVTAQWIGVLGAAEDAVVEAFTHGRGVPYGAYQRFHEVMAEESQQTVVDGLLPHILPLAQDVKRRLESGIDVLDVACGSGRAMIALGQAYPASLFTGVDLSPIAVGRRPMPTPSGEVCGTSASCRMTWPRCRAIRPTT